MQIHVLGKVCRAQKNKLRLVHNETTRPGKTVQGTVRLKLTSPEELRLVMPNGTASLGATGQGSIAVVTNIPGITGAGDGGERKIHSYADSAD